MRKRRRKAAGTYLGGWGRRRTAARAPPFHPAPGSGAGPGSPSGRAASLLLRLSRGSGVSPQQCWHHRGGPSHHRLVPWATSHYHIIPVSSHKGRQGTRGGDPSCPGSRSPWTGRALRAVPHPHATSTRPSSEVVCRAPWPFICRPRAKSKEPHVAPHCLLLTSSPEIPAVNG